MQMFSHELLKRAICQPAKPRWLERMVSWWRRITGRDRYYMGTDPGNGDSAAWCVMKRDTKTGLLTVVECGTGEPPANDKLRHSAPVEDSNNTRNV